MVTLKQAEKPHVITKFSKMFPCTDLQRRQFFQSKIKEPQKRKDLIEEFLKRKPWREILKKEISYDSDDENCTIVRAFLQDQEPGQKVTPQTDKMEECDKLTPIECWHKLKELTKYLPELKCILNDVNYASLSEKGSNENEKLSRKNKELSSSKSVDKSSENVSDSEIRDSSLLNMSAINTKMEFRSGKRKNLKLKPLSEILYSNEDFARVLDGIVYKEILELIDFDGEIETRKPGLSLDPRASHMYYDPALKGLRSVAESELLTINEEKKRGDESEEGQDILEEGEEEVITGPIEEEEEEVEEDIDDNGDTDKIEESAGMGAEDLHQVSQASRSTVPSSLTDKAETLIHEESSEDETVTPSEEDEGESSESLSDPDALLQELLGNINFQDVVEEWKIAKRKKEAEKYKKIAEGLVMGEEEFDEGILPRYDDDFSNEFYEGGETEMHFEISASEGMAGFHQFDEGTEGHVDFEPTVEGAEGSAEWNVSSEATQAVSETVEINKLEEIAGTEESLKEVEDHSDENNNEKKKNSAIDKEVSLEKEEINIEDKEKIDSPMKGTGNDKGTIEND